MKKVNSDVAYNFIRKRILNGEFPPGYPLTTEILSTKIGVSRTPVRDALQKLKADLAELQTMAADPAADPTAASSRPAGCPLRGPQAPP